MKKSIQLTFLLLVLSNFSFGQKLVVTPEGLRNAEDREKTHIVIDADTLTAEQLYHKALFYVHQRYKNPDAAIKGQIPNEYLKFDTYVETFLIWNNSGVKLPINATYTTELKFKEGKVRYEIVSLEMRYGIDGWEVVFKGGIWGGYPIYKKNGELYKEETKEDVENYFNSEIKLLAQALNENDKSDNW